MDPAIGYAFALVFILVGLAGMVLPALPGVPLVFAGLLLAAWSDGFQHVGGFIFGIPGVLLGPFLGALLAEWLVFRNLGRAAKAGGGAAIGLLIGVAVKIAVVFTMLGVFALAWWID